MIKAHTQAPCVPPVRLTVADVVILANVGSKRVASHDVAPEYVVPEDSGAPEDNGPQDADEDGDIQLPETDLPEVDAEDAEALLEDMPNYADLLEADLLEADLLDDKLLEQTIELGEVDNDRSSALDVGLTLDLNGPETLEELVQVVDLDVGSLLTLLPQEDSQLDPDALGRDLGPSESPLAVGALRDILLPEAGGSGELDGSDDGVWDDQRFPAFEGSPGVRPEGDEEDDNLPDDSS
jgi:hypothetical protein